jgi:hypothetical protein
MIQECYSLEEDSESDTDTSDTSIHQGLAKNSSTIKHFIHLPAR